MTEIGSASTETTKTASTGTYTITGLAAGTYDVEFMGCGRDYVTQWYDGAATSTGATAVSVTTSATTSGIDAVMAAGGAISGTVTSTAPTSPTLGTICVSATETGGGSTGNTLTTSNGTYTITGLAAGTYDVEFTGCGPDYVAQWYDGAATLAAATAVTVTAGTTTTGIDAAMVAGGAISGTVTSTAATTPTLGTICVVATEIGGGSNGFARTASNGTYTITGLVVGTYRVSFTGCGANYLIQWYTDAATPITATTVPVTAGTVTTGIDASMAPGGEITGTVTSTAATTPPIGTVCVVATAGSGGASGFARTASDGTYTIVGLPTGSYAVEFTNCGANFVKQWYDGAASPTTAAAVPVTAGSTTTGIDASMAPGGEITGTVTSTAATTPPIGTVCVSAYVVGGVGSGFALTAASDGAYTIVGLPTGAYTVEFTNCGTDFVNQWYDGAATPTAATAVSVSAGSTTAGISASMAPGGEITGTVTSTAATAPPIGTVCVFAHEVAGPSFGFASTASNGTYTLTGLATGSYTVSFTSCGANYVSQWYDGAADATTATAVPVTAGSTTTGIDASMALGGEITGSVTSSGATPVPVGTVCVLANEVGGPNFGFARTASGGTYAITGLAAGSYVVEFTSCGTAYLTQWYDGAATPTTATPVSVTAGTVTPGIDASMVVAGSISGTVTTAGPTPQPLAGICVTAFASGGRTSATATTASNGTYTLTGLAAGSYLVEFTGCGLDYATQWYPGAATQTTAAPVSVTAGTVTTGVNASMVVGGSISGTVATASATPQPIGTVCVTAVETGGGSVGSTSTAANGSYTVSGLDAGTYTVEFTGCGQDVLRQWYSGAASATTATTVSVTAGNVTTGIDASMVAGGSISGTVTSTAATTPPIGTVCVSVSTANGGFSFASTASNGTYTITGLAAGSYTVEFTGCGQNYLTQWYSGDATAATATTVTVTAGSTTSGVDAAMAVGGEITGTVTNSAAVPQPLGTVCVSASGPSNQFAYATTAPDGTYTLVGLATGTYTVEFTACGQNYLTQWYSGAATATTATPVGVTAGSTTSGIGAAMVAGAVITGTVTSATTSAGVGTVCVLAALGGGVVEGATTASDGAYSIPGLAAGTYKVEFTGCGEPYARQWYDGATTATAATPLSVTAGSTISGIDAALSPAGRISGTVTSAATPTQDLAGICVTAFAGSTPMTGATTASNGTYTITGLAAGTYTVQFTGCGQSFLTQWYTDVATRATATPVSVTAGSTTSNIDASMTVGGIAPTFVADSPPTSATVGKLYTYTFSASGNPRPTYALSGGPTWLSIDAATGAVSGTPPSGTTTFTYSVTAANGVAPAATAGPFTVTVSSTPTPPPAPTGTKTVKSARFTTPSGTGTLTDAAIGLSVTAKGAGALTVGAYTSNPTGTALSDGTGTYLDVEIATGSSFTSLSIRVCALGAGTDLEWWNGTSWVLFTNVHLATGCLVATVTQTSTPDLAELTGTPLGVVAPVPTRVFGKTADATAAAELEHVFPHTGATATCAGGTTGHAVVVARDTFFSDALASQDLAQSLGTGTLLTPKKKLSTPTRTALRVEGIQTVYVIGGTLAITTTVVNVITSLPAYTCGGGSVLKEPTGADRHLSVQRIYGQTEYGTAEKIAEKVGSAPKLAFSGAYAGVNATGGNGKFNDTAGKASSAPSGPTLPTAILATGTSWMDAESASALSYTSGVPILLTPAASLSATARTALEKLGVKQVVIMGGQLAVSNTVEQTLTSMGISVLRVAGKDYTDTAAELASFELSAGNNGLGWEPAHTGVLAARGDFYTDGLAGAVMEHAGATSQTPLLLTFDPSKLGTYATAFLKAAGTTGAGIGTDHETLTELTVLGGKLAVTTATASTMQHDLTP